ncbi:MAG TPA: indolepyruvate ferredoxin oxidoreductase subunit alpha [Candidatus Korarchaeota archaeon]|nr:indolepyruvate ferredoxin oxidoreductase subunit alpha [Candidatus Korarchaeota archaeon]
MLGVLAPANRVEALLGNEAIVRGAIEAGLDVAAAYPGTPSTEIGETLSTIAKQVGLYFEWSTNEKVAAEVVIAAAWSGLRAMTSMKHVGLNVASDALFTLAYAGTKGGLVIVNAGDPSAHSSQNEQDNRYYAVSMGLPMLEPYNSQEAKDYTKEAFELSERYGIPFIVRTTTRVSHSRGPVLLGEIKEGRGKGNFKPERFDQYLQVGAIARKNHKILLEKLERIEKEAGKDQKFFKLEGDESSSLGIITSGISYSYAWEALKRLELKVRLLKLGLTFPFPKDIVSDFIKELETLIVIEELEPFLEMQAKALAKDCAPELKILGKLTGHFPRVAEYTPRIVVEVLAKITSKTSPLNIQEIERRSKSAFEKVPSRPPVLCPACPHRATGYSVRRATSGRPTIYVGDIGCYALLFQKPFEVEHITHAMGSSMGFSNGFSLATDQPVVTLIGDSTFFHAGIPALINAVHNKHSFVAIILDNRITAMTGHQSHPGVPIDAMGEEAPMIDIGKLVRSMGIEYVKEIDPYNFKEMERAIREALDRKDLSVIIAKRECALLTIRDKRKKGERIIPYQVDPEKCTHCLVCINTYACPAFKDMGERMEIDPSVCFGCGSCVPICPFGAIEPGKGAKPWYEEVE